MVNSKRTGSLVRAWRRAHGISPDELARMVGRSTWQMRKIENGQRDLVLELAVPISKITGIPLQQLARPEDVRLVEEAALLLGFRRASRKRSSRKPRAGGGSEGQGPAQMAAAGAIA